MSKLNKAAFALAKRVTDARNVIPILDCALVKGNILRATNMDMELEHRVEGLADGLYHVRKSAAIGEAVPEPHMSEADFPQLQRIRRDKFYKFEAAMVREVLGFVSKEETRYHLNGIFFNDGVVVATDGHTMCRKLEGHKLINMIIPTYALAVLPVKGKIYIALAANDTSRYAMIKVNDDATIYTKLIEGAYPDYKRAIPEPDDDQAGHFELPINWIADATRTCKLASVEGKKVPIVKLGDHAFNAKYLLRLPKTAHKFFQKTPSDAMRFDVRDSTYVIMPMRA